jgi:hypothetical protein
MIAPRGTVRERDSDELADYVTKSGLADFGTEGGSRRSRTLFRLG